MQTPFDSISKSNSTAFARISIPTRCLATNNGTIFDLVLDISFITLWINSNLDSMQLQSIEHKKDIMSWIICKYKHEDETNSICIVLCIAINILLFKLNGSEIQKIRNYH